MLPRAPPCQTGQRPLLVDAPSVSESESYLTQADWPDGKNNLKWNSKCDKKKKKKKQL